MLFRSYVASQAGNYAVTVDVNGCTATDAVQVSVLPQPVVGLGPDRSICAGATVVLDATTPGATYLWQDGSTQATYVASQAGNYAVTVDVNGCTATDAVIVELIPIPFMEVDNAPLLCVDGELVLEVITNVEEVIWGDGEAGPVRTIVGPGSYNVTVVNACGTLSEEVVVRLDACACEVHVPNAFTPQDDGVNDMFSPISNCVMENTTLYIHDRWGHLLFTGNDGGLAWDGRHYRNGELVQNGVYIWSVVTTLVDGPLRNTRSLRGHVVVVR